MYVYTYIYNPNHDVVYLCINRVSLLLLCCEKDWGKRRKPQSEKLVLREYLAEIYSQLSQADSFTSKNVRDILDKIQSHRWLNFFS